MLRSAGVFTLLLCACKADEPASARRAGALPTAATPVVASLPTYPGMGSYHRHVSTESDEAQHYFDQGLQLVYGFNHDEAIRSFRQAAALDPDCVMAYWGVAHACGIHVNNTQMSEAKSREGHEAAQEALRRIERASPVEAALVRAVVARFAWPIPEDRRPLDEAYAEAMGAAWREHGYDPDVGALYAESLMNLQPWDYWTHDGEPKGRAEEIVATLERVLEMNADHPGANHFYIHAIEASKDPGRAVEEADRLGQLVPGSGHLVHMPSHIYIRLGRYGDAADTNERAIEVDRAYFAVAPPPDFYSIYFVHNIHFLAYAAMMEARFSTAIEAARRLEREIPESFVRGYPHIADGFLITPLHVLVRFGKWQEVLDEPEAPEFRRLSRAARHYARGVALSNLGDPAGARAELAAFDADAALVPEDWSVGNNSAHVVLPLARAMLEGEILFREGKHDEAFASLRDGVRREDELVYDEPPGWLQPVRHALGALLLAADRPVEAEQVYREDLARNAGNGWSMLGLELALRRQDEFSPEATALAEARAGVWTRSDVQPTSSCYCAP